MGSLIWNDAQYTSTPGWGQGPWYRWQDTYPGSSEIPPCISHGSTPRVRGSWVSRHRCPPCFNIKFPHVPTMPFQCVLEPIFLSVWMMLIPPIPQPQAGFLCSSFKTLFIPTGVFRTFWKKWLFKNTSVEIKTNWCFTQREDFNNLWYMYRIMPL